MTQLQKIVAKAKILKKSYPNAKWTDLIKKASKLVTPASKSVAGTKKVIKKSTARSLHKDTKSHNVNIRVMSGLPDNFSFSIGKFKAYTHKQITIYGDVELVIFNFKDNSPVTYVTGKNQQFVIDKLVKAINQENDYKLEDGEIKRIKKLVSNLSSEVNQYNKKNKIPRGSRLIDKVRKKSPIKKSIVKKSKVKRSTSRSTESEKIRSTVKKDGFIMPHGYQVTKGKRMMAGIGSLTIDQLKRNNQIIENFTTKHIPYMMEQYKYAPSGQKSFIKGRILEAKKYVATLKKQNTGLKKHIK